MRYFTQEVQTDGKIQRTAGVKARDDVDSILLTDGWKAIQVTETQKRSGSSITEHISGHVNAYKSWNENLGSLQKDDVLLVQFPILSHSVFLWNTFRKLKKRGVYIILLIHDLEILRKAVSDNVTLRAKMRLNAEEKSILKLADKIIAHNTEMIKVLSKMGISKERLVNLKIFDYLMSDFSVNENLAVDKPVIIAGNLSKNKAEYVYRLPDSCRFNLYGVGYEGEEKENITYHGSFPPDELPAALSGSFGLIWDGNSSETCSGAYGAYLRINNPHKTSLYLSCGIPVVIWKEAALAKFVEKHQCGILIDSLDTCNDVISSITHEQYRQMCRNAEEVSKHLRNGDYIRSAVKKCISK
ncbi:MAG TPA: hypothetical protein PLH98_02700 [Ruminococcus flavefaciens]|nr:hypothetical protein [Ruminococcus flavefaciens]